MNLRHSVWTIIGVYVFFIAGGIWNSLGYFQEFMVYTTPAVLVLTAVLSYALTYRISWKSGLAAVAIFVVTWGVEALGVATGFPFGAYVYTDTLGLQVLGVSLVIPFAWIAVISGSDAVTGHFFTRVSVLLVGLFATIFDFFLEFAADALDYWHWEGGFPPTSNYMSWFVISVAAAALLRDTTKRRVHLRLPAHLYVAQLWYFAITVVGIKSRLFLP
jgi:bisanhydrobacterioruberin hydratase